MRANRGLYELFAKMSKRSALGKLQKAIADILSQNAKRKKR